ncbi:MAG: hypothetical protein JWO76_1409, partial [Nocardioides sp.]|nr:hypothetical protein [Nocardioides sp.]
MRARRPAAEVDLNESSKAPSFCSNGARGSEDAEKAARSVRANTSSEKFPIESPEGRGLQRWPLIAVAAGIALLVAAALVVNPGSHGDGDPSADGAVKGDALRVPPFHAWVVDYPLGTTFTDGLERLVNTGSDPATIRRVELLGDDVPFEIVGAMYAGEHRKVGSLQLSKGFPPDRPGLLGPVQPLEGAVVEPDDELGLELLLGLRVIEEGYAERTGIRVYY